MNSGLYFDYNASTPVAKPVLEAMNYVYENCWGNPGSAHRLGLKAKEAMETARKKVASLIKAGPQEVIFNSGGTEGNNTVLLAVTQAVSVRGRHIITTQVEHPSVLNPCIHLMEMGWDVSFARVNSDGIVEPEEIKRLLRPQTVLVSVMLANNETGSIMPVKEIAELVKEQGALIHTDAAQAVGKMPVNVRDLMVDYLTVAGHKLYGPKGIGAVFVKDGAPFTPLLLGGGQEGGKRAGTEPVSLIVGIGEACSFVMKDLEEEQIRQEILRERLYEGICRIWKDVVRHSPSGRSLSNTLLMSLLGLEGGDVLDAAEPLMASTGAACHDRSVKASHVLSAMGVDKKTARGAIRFSIGRYTSERDVDDAIAAISRAVSA
jgi:cysteine desulfurase